MVIRLNRQAYNDSAQKINDMNYPVLCTFPMTVGVTDSRVFFTKKWKFPVGYKKNA